MKTLMLIMLLFVSGCVSVYHPGTGKKLYDRFLVSQKVDRLQIVDPNGWDLTLVGQRSQLEIVQDFMNLVLAAQGRVPMQQQFLTGQFESD